ncbi:conserved hypothetical protein [Candidatus Methanoperedens nitroreducens]|uniref:Uncharacterized protein n=1 Tax=Candidatus Methanoperedens nitratireducens TaxID=1392998 RepID=A0A284VMQ6_9EURY|nr:conserved hypothetical protein [Candidatus Methanoperedens nitroreducens]
MAPFSPRISNMGPKASPVPCPPVMVTEPAIRPRKGSTPINIAINTPTTFWKIARKDAKTQKKIIWRPPTLRREKLAPSPILVKKAIKNGDRRVVSNWKAKSPVSLKIKAKIAKVNPPTTGAGMAKRLRTFHFLIRK